MAKHPPFDWGQTGANYVFKYPEAPKPLEEKKQIPPLAKIREEDILAIREKLCRRIGGPLDQWMIYQTDYRTQYETLLEDFLVGSGTEKHLFDIAHDHRNGWLGGGCAWQIWVTFENGLLVEALPV